MSTHLTEAVIAKANAAPLAPEESDGDTGEPRILHLYLDEDELYRWYTEDGTGTNARGATLHDALSAARVAWPSFTLIEYRGDVIEPRSEETIPNMYAADESEETRRREEPSQPGS